MLRAEKEEDRKMVGADEQASRPGTQTSQTLLRRNNFIKWRLLAWPANTNACSTLQKHHPGYVAGDEG